MAIAGCANARSKRCMMDRFKGQKNVPGTVYLLCFERPLAHARHYLGWASDLDRRLNEHRLGYGARLLAALIGAGIGWSVSRTWEGETRRFERALKNMKCTPRMCPRCSPQTSESESYDGSKSLGSKRAVRKVRRKRIDAGAARDERVSA